MGSVLGSVSDSSRIGSSSQDSVPKRKAKAKAKAKASAGPARFSTTHFKQAYEDAHNGPGNFHVEISDLKEAVHEIVSDFMQAVPDAKIDDAKKDKFLQMFWKKCEKPGESSEILVEKCWTCAEDCNGWEFCHMVNQLLCLDQEDMRHVAIFVRALNTFCVTGVGRGPNLTPSEWPSEHTVYRSGGMPIEHQEFFKENVKYRAPRILPASFEYLPHFALRGKCHPPVKWIIQLPKCGECRQANYVTRRADGVKDEKEFVFAAYTVFTVVSVSWSSRPFESPHEIVLSVPVDNRDEADDLVLSPWC